MDVSIRLFFLSWAAAVFACSSDDGSGPTQCTEQDGAQVCGGAPCVDGYCCDAPCDGPCESCDQAGFEGSCLPVAPESHHSRQCVDGAVQWLDSCGAAEEVDVACPANAVCRNTSATEAACCTLQSHRQCGVEDSHVHWIDSCGFEGEVAESCPANADCENTTNSQASCVCRNHWEGEGCSECPPRWNPARDCGSCLPGTGGEDCDEHCRVYVDIDATDENPDGNSWATAFTDPAEGIAAAHAAATRLGWQGCEIWVAEGTYYVYRSSPEDHLALFVGLWLYGGFDGTEEQLDERDPEAHVTVFDGRDGDGGQSHVQSVFVAQARARLDGVTVRHGGVAEHESSRGGALRAEGAHTLTVAGCAFQSNRASSGGAVFAGGEGIVVEDCHFEGNVADVHEGGGGLKLEATGTEPFVVRGTSFVDNTGGPGGGADIAGRGTMDDVTFRGNDGGLRHSGPIEISDATFESQTSFGALTIAAGQDEDDGASLEQVTFRGNHGTRWAGGIHQQSGWLSCARCEVLANAGPHAGGVYVAEEATYTHFDGRIIGNSAIDGAGGLACYGQWLSISGVVATNLSASDAGGLRVESRVLQAEGLVVSGNTGSGGGMVLHDVIEASITDPVVAGNRADGSGSAGGLGVWGLEGGGSLRIRNPVVAGNQGDVGGLMLAAARFEQGDIWHGTITANRSDQGAERDGGMYVDIADPYLWIYNTIVWGSSGNGTNLTVAPESEWVFVMYSLVGDGQWDPWDGNLDTDPLWTQLPEARGTWASATYSEERGQTDLTDPEARWDLELVTNGFVVPDTEEGLWLPIAAVSDTVVTVEGDAVAMLELEGNETYELKVLTLAPGSPAIDAGAGRSSGSADILGQERHDDPSTTNFGGAPPGEEPAFADMGAYEFQGDSEMCDLSEWSLAVGGQGLAFPRSTNVGHGSHAVVSMGSERNSFESHWSTTLEEGTTFVDAGGQIGIGVMQTIELSDHLGEVADGPTIWIMAAASAQRTSASGNAALPSSWDLGTPEEATPGTSALSLPEGQVVISEFSAAMDGSDPHGFIELRCGDTPP